jgi:ornithine cyclodeaminase
MIFISEEESTAIITEQLAFDAVRDAFISATDERSDSFATVLGHGSAASDRFTIKSASTADIAGLKVGTYWPGNSGRGLDRHNSLIMIFDQEIGRIGAVIEAGKVNAYRTAAADAVAASVLARHDAASLAIFGTGHQAFYECVALSRVRPIETIHVVARHPERGAAFLRDLAIEGLGGVIASPEQACAAADIIVTATTAQAPLFEAHWVKPGTHVASMGSDAQGKQELPEAVLEMASLFCDWPVQSLAIGEFQHVAEMVSSGILNVTAIGDVLTGAATGRWSTDEITVFDSSGIALQDLYVGAALLREARTRNPS